MSSVPLAPSHSANTPSEQNGSDAGPKKRGPAKRNNRTRLLHVNLPIPLVDALRAMADEDKRTYTSMVEILLEESPEMIEYQRKLNLPRVIQG